MKVDGKAQKFRSEHGEQLLPLRRTGESDEGLMGDMRLIVPSPCGEDSTAIHRGVLMIDAWRNRQDEVQSVG